MRCRDGRGLGDARVDAKIGAVAGGEDPRQLLILGQLSKKIEMYRLIGWINHRKIRASCGCGWGAGWDLTRVANSIRQTRAVAATDEMRQPEVGGMFGDFPFGIKGSRYHHQAAAAGTWRESSEESPTLQLAVRCPTLEPTYPAPPTGPAVLPLFSSSPLLSSPSAARTVTLRRAPICPPSRHVPSLPPDWTDPSLGNRYQRRSSGIHFPI